MKKAFFFIVCALSSFSVFSQIKTKSFLDSKSVELQQYDENIVINFNYEIESLTQNHFKISAFSNPKFKWTQFLNYTFGNEMDPIHEDITDKVTGKLYDYALKHKLNGDSLLNLIIAFSNSIESENENTDGYFYYPYEIFMSGIHDSNERMTVFASLLSSFCFDIQFAVYDSGFVVGVLSEGGEIYFGDNQYKVLKDYNGNRSTQIFSLSERCKYKSIPFEPIQSDPNVLAVDALATDGYFSIKSATDGNQMTMSIAGMPQQSRQKYSYTTTTTKGYVFDIVDGKITRVLTKFY